MVSKRNQRRLYELLPVRVKALPRFTTTEIALAKLWIRNGVGVRRLQQSPTAVLVAPFSDTNSMRR